eukprot:gene10275-7297_t
MLKLGSDFAYSNAPSWYQSLDVLIDEVNQRDTRYNVFYSDPTSYMKARAQETASQAVVWPEKRDDFFPYSDASHTFWTGYFTSRPQFKYFERYASGFLQMIRQFAAQSRHVGPAMQAQMTKATAKLSAAVGLANHHDCITGTEKQHVADDYKRILDAAMQEAEAVFLSTPLHGDAVEATLPSPQFTTCRLMNETLCSATQTLQPGDAVLVAVYNPQPRTTVTPRLVTVLLAQEAADAAEVVVLPVDRAYTSLEAALAHGDGVRFAKAELFPALTLADVYANDPIYATQAANVRLVFTTEALPALSTRHFLVTLMPKTSAATAKVPSSTGHALALAKLRNVEGFVAAKPAIVEEFPTLPLTTGGHHFDVHTSTLQLAFDRVTGQLRSITRTRDTASYVVTVPGGVGIGFYNAFGGAASSPLYRPLKKHDTRDPHLQNLQPHPEVVAQGVSTQPSGAYIFRTARANEALHAACQLANDLSAVKTATPADTSSCDATAALGHVQQMVVVRGTLMAEVHQRFANWASHTYRVVEGDDRVEVEYQLGEIPVSDDVGKEIVYRLDTDLVTLTNDSSSPATPMWFTDSNGREFLPRRYNYRPTWDLQVYEPIAA